MNDKQLTRTIRPLAVLGLMLLAQPALSEVAIDYDPDARFGEYRTYALDPAEDFTLAESDPVQHARLLGLLRMVVESYDLERDDDQPDVHILYKVAIDPGTRLHTSSGYGYGPRWGRYEYRNGVPHRVSRGTSRDTAYDEGTLIVDVWDTKTDKLIWRGTATAQIASDPRSTAVRMQKSIDQLAKRWQRIRRRELGIK